MRSFFAVALLTVSVGLVGCASSEGAALATGELRADCSLVRCAIPLCAEGQHLVYGNSCCPHCVGPLPRTSRCAAVLCAAVACDEGEELVTSPGDCCGHCVPAHPVAECETDRDCPSIYCFTCPCPVSECRGRECVTWTPDASTCGYDLAI